MICISVTPTSRKLAKVDILNASRHGDLIEVCLDKLVKTPDIGDLIRGFEKPILISCRRPEDGGHWEGTEEDRLQLLRNAIIAGPAYIELELDIADTIPPFGDVKRVVSINSITRPLGRIDDIFERAKNARADVVKFTWPTRTLDEAWPLLAAVSQRRELPVVGMGLGESSVTFSLLGRKFGSPWIYAALEQGMEAHEGQKTVWDLREAYGWQEVSRKTRFIGVVGMGETELASTRVMNEAFRKAGADIRCLPLRLGEMKHVDKMLSTLKVKGLIVGSQDVESVFPLIEHKHRTVEESGFADLVVKRDDVWHGHNTLRTAIVNAIKAAGRDLAKRRVTVVGTTPIAKWLLPILTDVGAATSIAAPDDKSSKAMAETYGASFVTWSAMYDTVSEFVILTDPTIPIGHDHTRDLNPSLLRESTTVVDLSRFPEESKLIEEGRSRGCTVIEPSDIYVHQLSGQFKALTGKELDADAFRSGLLGFV